VIDATVLQMLSWLDGEAVEQIQDKVRAVAPTLRWLVDHEIAILKEFVRPKQFVVALPQASAWLASTERHH
jgi:hypothetical protein